MSQNDRALDALSFPVQYLEIGESLFQARGLDSRRLYAACGLGSHPAARLGQTINGHQLRRQFELLQAHFEPGSPPLLQLMAHFPLTMHGPLGMLALTSATLGEALEGALKYAPLIMPAFAIRRENHGQAVHLVFERRYDFAPVNELFTESVLATFLKIGPFLSRLPQAIQLHFSHSSPYPPEAYAGLGAQFCFGSKLNQIVLQARDLDIPLIAPSRSSHLLMQATLEQQRLLQADAHPTRQQLKRLLQQALQDDQPLDAAQLAEQLKLSTRTLSRRLQAEGTTLPQLQAEVSLEYAELLLLDTEKTVADIAQRCGFQDATSFARAFKRFSGQSPSQFRRGGQTEAG